MPERRPAKKNLLDGLLERFFSSYPTKGGRISARLTPVEACAKAAGKKVEAEQNGLLVVGDNQVTGGGRLGGGTKRSRKCNARD